MTKTILIIDDEVNIRISLKDILTEYKYLVSEAGSGKEGIERLKKEKFDLVLLDTKMDGTNGIEICRQIKKIKKIPVKVIVYTAKVDAIAAVEAREAGADDYCVKGEDPVLLLEAIKKIFKR